jgi:hypothetical protein
MPHS